MAAKVLQSEDLGEAEAFEQESMTLENLHYLHLVAHLDHAFHDGKVRQSCSQTWTLITLHDMHSPPMPREAGLITQH